MTGPAMTEPAVTGPATAGAGSVLRTKIALLLPSLQAAADRVWDTPPARERYIGYLSVMHAVIRASVPLMRVAARRCATAGGDPVALPLREYLRGHIAEERGHDDWIAADLAASGEDPGRCIARIPPAEVAALVGAQYYWIEHYHPVTLLGYIAVLEGNPPKPELVHHLMDITGLPAPAFRTLRAHAELDPGHAAAVFTLLDELALTADQRQAIDRSALHCLLQATRIMADLAAGP
jgi:Iron-containing redox enzyme